MGNLLIICPRDGKPCDLLKCIETRKSCVERAARIEEEIKRKEIMSDPRVIEYLRQKGRI